jgi:integrase
VHEITSVLSPVRKRPTERVCSRVKPPATGRDEYWEPLIPGFGLRMTKEGTKTFVVMYRHRGRLRRMTLGRYHEERLTLEKAKEKAEGVFEEIEAGRDPAARKAGYGNSVEAIFAEYEARHLKNTRKAKEARRMFNKDVKPHIGDRAIFSVTRGDIIELLDKVLDRNAPISANRLRTLLLSFFSWAAERGHVTANPVAAIRKPAKECSRERVLGSDEIADVWQGSEAIGWPFGSIFKLLLTTGQRLREVSEMEWGEVDIEGERAWIIPAERSKSNRAHLVPLSDLAIEVLKEMPRIDDVLVFTTLRRRGEVDDEEDARPVSGFARAKRRLDREINKLREREQREPIGPFRLHDLRRTVGTQLEELGVQPRVVGAVLNHAPARFFSSAGAVYARYEYDPEKRKALDAWAERLRNIVGRKT